MNINALSNPYLQQDLPVEALPVPAENPEQVRLTPSERSLAIRKSEHAASLLRKQTPDSVNISGSFGNESGQERRTSLHANGLRYDKTRMRNWDHKLKAWFRTAVTVQGTMPKSRGLHIDIVV